LPPPEDPFFAVPDFIASSSSLAICARNAPSTFSIPDQSATEYQIVCVLFPGARRNPECTPHASTTPSAISLSRTGAPTVFTNSRNCASFPGFTVYSYQNVSGCIFASCATAVRHVINTTAKQSKILFFIFSDLLERTSVACVGIHQKFLGRR